MKAHESTFWDTSAFSKLVLKHEADTELASSIYEGSAERHTSRLTWPESHSALARHLRMGLLSGAESLAVRMLYRELRREFIWVNVDNSLLQLASELVFRHPLTAGDAIQIATALRTAESSEITFVTWDRQQASAARGLGLDVLPDID